MDNTLGYEPGDVSSILAGGATLGATKWVLWLLFLFFVSCIITYVNINIAPVM